MSAPLGTVRVVDCEMILSRLRISDAQLNECLALLKKHAKPDYETIAIKAGVCPLCFNEFGTPDRAHRCLRSHKGVAPST